MKKIMPVLFLLLFLSACGTEQIAVVPKTEFTYDATVAFCDFSYHAMIKYTNGSVYVTPKTTHANGMTISCDGTTVTFTQKGYSNSVPVEQVSDQNPAKLLYSVLASVSDKNMLCQDDMYTYQGKTNSGSYVLCQNSAGDYTSLKINSIPFSVIFRHSE